MCTETVIKTIERVCEGQCNYVVHQSESTNSVYCTLQLGNAITNFRISDHPQKRHNMHCFIYYKNTKKATMARFITNVIKDLKRKSFYLFVESITSIIEYA